MPTVLKLAYGAAAIWSLLLVAVSERDPIELPARGALLMQAADADPIPPIPGQFEQRWTAITREPPPPPDQLPPPLLPTPPLSPPASISIMVPEVQDSEPVRIRHHPHRQIERDRICKHGRYNYQRDHHRYWRCRR